MELFKRPDIDFIGLRRYPYALSILVVLGSLFAVAAKGLNYSIEFTGGALLQVTFAQPLELGDVRSALERQGIEPEIQSVAGKPSFILRQKGTEEGVETAAAKMTRALESAFPANALAVDRKEFIGPVVGRDLKRRTLWAIVLSLLAILVYVAVRFPHPLWGVMGVLALFHDVIGTVGLFALLGKQVDLLIVTALLTIAGYSINDTIIIYDRMREMLILMRREPLDRIVNTAVNDTLSRTIITVLTVQIVCVVLLVFGGPVIHDFALAMVVGNLLGTYSTIGVAAPLVYEWDRRSKAAAPPAFTAAPFKGAGR